MRRIALLAVTAAFLICMSSCNNGKSGLLIPKDAIFALQINNSSLTSKLSWDEVKKTGWYKEIYNDTNDSLGRQLMENPEASGVDIKSEMGFFMRPQGNGGYSVFQGKLKDAKLFEDVLRKMRKDIAIEKDGDYKFVKDPSTLVTWSDSRFFIFNNMPFLGMTGTSYGMQDMSERSFPLDSLRKFSKELFDLKSDNSLNEDKRFTASLKEEGDVHFWINAEKYYSGLTGGAFSMMKVSDLFKGNVSTAALNFDNGKITVKAKQYYGEMMAAIIGKYNFKNVSADLFNRIPSNNVIAVLAGSGQPALFEEILTAAGLNGMVNGFLGKYNSNLHEAVQALKGDLLLAFTDFSMKKDTSEYGFSSPKPDVNVLFALSVNNKATFDKMIGIAKQQAGGDTATLNKVSYKTTNEWFALSNKADMVDNFLSGSAKSNAAYVSKITGHHLGGYIDLQKMIQALHGTGGKAEDEVYDASLKMWQDVIITGNYEKGASTSEFVINLVDKSTNSLKQLSRYGDQLAAISKKEKEQRNREYEQYKDSTIEMPPVEEMVPTPPPPAPVQQNN